MEGKYFAEIIQHGRAKLQNFKKIFSTGMLAKSWEVVSFDLEALSPDLAKLLKLSWWKAGEQIAPLPSHFGPRSPRLRIAGISRRRYIHLQPGATNQR